MTPLTLVSTQVPALPLLSWLGVVDFSSKKVEVQHGDWVETGDRYVVEGVWSGEFQHPSFHSTDSFFGSGLVIENDVVVVVPSTATTDFCYYRFAEGVLCVSNSLPLLLAALDDELDPHNSEYEAINESIAQGITAYRRVIPTRCGNVCRLMHNNLYVDEDGAREVEKPMPPEIENFGEYSQYLSSRIDLLFRNARSPVRSKPFLVYSTQSKGYDTTAVNALAAPFGVDRVFTCPETKERRSFFMRRSRKSRNMDDDGTPICEVLNLPAEYIDRQSVLNESPLEVLFHAGLHCNQDLNFLDIFTQIQQPTLLLTGVLGEMWYARNCVAAHRYEASDQLKRWDLGGHSLAEVRLHTGVIQLPIPYIAARRRSDLLRITESTEMEPWRLGSSYDRPIPRRMAEEAGVPRDFFGQKKMATVVHLPFPATPVASKLNERFHDFLAINRLMRRWQYRLLPVVQRINSVMHWYKPQQYLVDSLDAAKGHRHAWRYRIGYVLNRCYAALVGRPPRPTFLWKHLNASLYCFAVNEVSQTVYKQALAHTSTITDPRVETKAVSLARETGHGA